MRCWLLVLRLKHARMGECSNERRAFWLDGDLEKTRRDWVVGFFLFCCYPGCRLEPKALRWAEPIWIGWESCCVGLRVSSPDTSVVRGCTWRCGGFRSIIIIGLDREFVRHICLFTTTSEFLDGFQHSSSNVIPRYSSESQWGKTLPTKGKQELLNYISVPGQALNPESGGWVCHRGQMSAGFGNRCACLIGMFDSGSVVML